MKAVSGKRMTRAIVAGAAGMTLAFSGLTTANAVTVSAPVDSAAAVADVSPAMTEVAGASAQQQAVTGNVVTISGDKANYEVSLPVSESAETTLSDGLLEISDSSSSSIVPVVQEDGSVAIHSVLADASAPTSYDYTLDLPAGSSIQVDPNGGGAVAVGSDGEALLVIGAPWATDANGNSIPTSYSASGNVLTQHVQISADTAFPVVADPWLGVNLVASYSWTWVSGSGWKLNVNPTLAARSFTGSYGYIVIGRAGWDELRNRIPSAQRTRLNESGKGQYVCHMGFAGFDAQWNLELWKKAKSDAAWVLSKCN